MHMTTHLQTFGRLLKNLLFTDINNLFLFLLLFGVRYAPVIKDAPVMTDRNLF